MPALVELPGYSYNGRRYGVSARATTGMRAFGRARRDAICGEHERAAHGEPFYAKCAGLIDKREEQ